VGIRQLVAYETGESILCVRDGYAALHKLLGGTWVTGRTACFLLYQSAKFEFDAFLSHGAMLARYVPSSCVRLCGVDEAYRRLGDGLVCSGHCTHAAAAGVHFLP